MDHRISRIRRFAAVCASIAFVISAAVPLSATTTPAAAQAAPVKNVIILIPDGMSVAGTTLARLFKGAPLVLDQLACGLMSTWNSDGTIADSAPAGSALSTGWKSQTGNIASTGKVYALPGVRTPDTDERLRPLATILEAARLSGKATGVIATSEFMHATPADFSAHDPSRSNYDNITEQMIYNGLDVILGGGKKYLSPSARKDREDMAAVLRSRGYAIVDSTAGLKNAVGSRLVGIFGRDDSVAAMSYDLDRDPVREPALETMTAKAIEVLSGDPDGFFLMVEGSKVDWAAHANDPVAIVTDILAFDRAVSAALEFAKKDGNTVVVAVSDHGNSGISVGDRSISSGYDKTPWTTFVDPLKRAKVTGEGLETRLPAGLLVDAVDASGKAVKKLDPAKAQALKAVVISELGLADVTDAELEAIALAKPGSLNYTVGPMVAARAKIGFTTNGHTGEDVVLYAYDPRGTRPAGLVDNTVIGKYLAAALGVDLDAATRRLFLEASSAFALVGASVSEDKTDAENPVLVAVKGGKTLRIPRNKSIAWLDGKEIVSEGVTVLSNSVWYVSRSLVEALR